MRRLGLIAIALASMAFPALAGDLTVSVRDAGGRPVQDAVVMVRTGSAPAAPIRFTWPYQVAQQNIQFDPFVLVVPVGSDVTFPNRDKVRHHVYSFSAAKKFELKLYGREESRTIHFEKPGVVALGCNIHDSMIAFIYVVDTPYASKTLASGDVVLRDVPAGAATLTVWHPFLKAASKAPPSRPIRVGGGAGREAMTVDVRPAMAGHGH